MKSLILAGLMIVVLISCAPETRPPLWLRAIETLPQQVEGFNRAGLFTINDKIYVQFCDPNGNQIWLRYKEAKHTWTQSRYNSQGCVDGERSTGPVE